MIKKIGILTSGGDAPGMNAAIRALTRSALSNGIEVVGIRNGYRGLVNGEYVEFDRTSVSDIMARGGTILGSARLPEFRDDKVVEAAALKLKNNSIDGIVVIGGDGSYRGALALCKYGINCVGLPGTIDNDISGTDFTLGFDTALNTVVEAIDKLKDTSASHHRCSIVEVMGNKCGDLAIYAGINSGAEILITPESGYDEEEVIEKLNHYEKAGKNHAIVVVTEKLCDVNSLASKITERTGFEARATVLGHIQRGGSPTPNDRLLAARLGVKAIDLLIEGKSGYCVGVDNYEVIALSIEEALNRPKKSRKEFYRIFERLV